MLVSLFLALSAGVAPVPQLATDALLDSSGGVCLGTGYCTQVGAGRDAAPPGGLMYLALGLVGIGLTVLRTGRPERDE